MCLKVDKEAKSACMKTTVIVQLNADSSWPRKSVMKLNHNEWSCQPIISNTNEHCFYHLHQLRIIQGTLDIPIASTLMGAVLQNRAILKCYTNILLHSI